MIGARPFIGCPQNGAIMDHYKPYFPNVLVVLHPFLSPRTIPHQRFFPDTYPSDVEILTDCTPVSWAEVLAQSNFHDLSQLDVALRSYFHTLKQPDHELVAKLEAVMSEMNIIPPTNGILAPHVASQFLNDAVQAGYEHILVSDEFGERIERKNLGTLSSSDIPDHGVLETEDHKILLTTHWDSCCSFLCTNELAPFAPLESFSCSQRTEVYWGLYPI